MKQIEIEVQIALIYERRARAHEVLLECDLEVDKVMREMAECVDGLEAKKE